MSITEDRVTIFTKNTGKYSGIALILDLTRSINHTYGSSVASHPIEGSGNTVADHQYLKNIKIQISGHVSNGVKVPLLAERVDNFTFTRDNDSYIEELDETKTNLDQDKLILEGIEGDEPLTEEEARVLTDGSDLGIEYSQGQVINPNEIESVKDSTLSNINNTLESIEAVQNEYTEDAKTQTATATATTRRVYASSQLNKQLDALILLENIRDNRLLVDVLTPNRLYRDMTLNFNLPRNMRQGTALEVNCVFEQQRFVEAEVESLPYSSDSDLIDDKDNKDEKPKEVKDPANIKRAEDILNTTIVE